MIKLHLQYFGGRGASFSKNSSLSISDRLKGKDIDTLKEYSLYGNQEKLISDFGLENANTYQINALRRLLGGIVEYDRGYDKEKTPFEIENIKIEQRVLDEEEKVLRKRIGMRNTAQPISVYIVTTPQTENAYIRMMDEKFRNFFIGSKGGFYTYVNGKKRSISEFDARYGSDKAR